MTVEDDRDNSPLEEQIFGVILRTTLNRFFIIVPVYCGILLKLRFWIVSPIIRPAVGIPDHRR
jgi:hypothetical protein